MHILYSGIVGFLERCNARIRLCAIGLFSSCYDHWHPRFNEEHSRQTLAAPPFSCSPPHSPGETLTAHGRPVKARRRLGALHERRRERGSVGFFAWREHGGRCRLVLVRGRRQVGGGHGGWRLNDGRAGDSNIISRCALSWARMTHMRVSSVGHVRSVRYMVSRALLIRYIRSFS